jgi:LPXTG-site transpeptidase (sortase) family protein
MQNKLSNYNSNSRNKKTYRVLGFVFLLIGIIGLALPFLSFGLLNDISFLAEAAKDQSVEIINPTPIPTDLAIVSQSNTPTTTPKSIAGYNPNQPQITDRLTIPQAGIDMPILQGNSVSILLKGGWLFPGTSTPDAGGNSVIFGHRFRYLPPISNTFYNLDKVKNSDQFTITWRGKIYTYQVVNIKIIEPTDLSVLAPSTMSQVTLVTCSPLFSSKQRLVVVAKQITY